MSAGTQSQGAQAGPFSRQVVLIACCGTKLPSPAPARLLYCSDLFRKSLVWSQSLRADSTFVLSALHGVVGLDQVVAPYDSTLQRMPAAERRAWGARCWASLAPRVRPDDTVIFLAGRLYREPLMPHLIAHGIDRDRIMAPLAGMGIGLQKRWLTKNT